MTTMLHPYRKRPITARSQREILTPEAIAFFANLTSDLRAHA